MIEKYSYFNYEIYKEHGNYVYIIYDEPNNHESIEWFDTEQESRQKAIEHINLLENGGFYYD